MSDKGDSVMKIEMKGVFTFGACFLCDKEDYNKLVDYTYHYGYNDVVTNNKSMPAHNIILGVAKYDGTRVEYINGNKLDLRKANLRFRKPAGVSRYKNGWNAYLTRGGKTISKYFETESEAREYRRLLLEEYNKEKS